LLLLVLGLQIVLGLLWGVSMVFFASVIVLGDNSGEHIEKIAIEGGAHLALVLAALLVLRVPERGRALLPVMIFLNVVWAVTDAVYIPLLSLTGPDFAAKLAVNATLGVGLAIAGRRAQLI
jgi:hypothetical protein